ncbi:putative capsular associated protein [Cladophialophora carrionii]|uniref:Putative capsular associated protein n=1 Tax=Cladophialophora carrionii TaxID=86049 RepID=A0A1C1CAA8_9EURO|nr:putative capsular associated protein [Cladophialophora carrionii]
MGPIEFNKKRILLLLAGVLAFYIVFHGLSFSSTDFSDVASKLPIPNHLTPTEHKLPPSAPDPDEIWDLTPKPSPAPALEDAVESDAPLSAPPVQRFDLHPIAQLMQQADAQWRTYETAVSTTFRQTVEKYRSKYGRHPPPGFAEWYKFARKRNVFNIDDFEQIMDDLRPFWAVNASEIRIRAAHMWENFDFGVSVVHIRDHKVVKVENPSWRSETMEKVIEKFINHLPDMDIPMNRLDQPRVVVPWEDMQQHLRVEYDTRVMPPEVMDSFTKDQLDLRDMSILDKADDHSTRLDDEWFFAPGKQYMKIAAKGCPPESPARSNMSIAEADSLYKEPLAGFVTNFNLSSDLCTIGPAIQDMHGMLYSASSIIASHKLVPIFGECKVNVNNDILFPANMYYQHDDRYDYNDKEDLDWREKQDTIIWRGVTSGGVQLADNWDRMHRQRLVRLLNGTYMGMTAKEVKVLMEKDTGPEKVNTTYEPFERFRPSEFIKQHSDVGFTEPMSCIPNCSFYNDHFTWVPPVSLTSQFKSKYLIDVDGHSFSGRWHAFLQSKSLGLKATIFREWHDSRLLAWRHFVPVDNRYDDLYALLTYFIGYGKPYKQHADEGADLNPQVFIAPHDQEAQKIARQGREWANKVLRREDIEVYMFRLLLEYGRLIDDNRDYIGYSGDGSELDKFDAGEENDGRWGIGGWRRS